MKTIDKDEFIRIIAERAGFTKGDVKIILDTMIDLFQESIKNEVIIKIRGFGRLKYQHLKERTFTKGKYAGMVLPPTVRVTWKLAENQRYAQDGLDD